MRKQIISILLTLCMILCFAPMQVRANDIENTQKKIPTGTALTQENICNEWFGNNTTFYLSEDVTITQSLCTMDSPKKITLDLNGHVLKMGEKNQIVICNGGELTLKDSNPTATHKFKVLDNGLWELDEENGTQTVAGGVITGGVVDGSWICGGVEAKKFTMEGGNIVGCQSSACDSSEVCAGGVYVEGTFTMNGGSITGCVSNSGTGGGGVYVWGTFIMNGGSIRSCIATDGGHAMGGGVVVRRGSFTMNGGSIENCSAQNVGGGVYTFDSGTFIMNGGSIQNCTAEDEKRACYGGGVAVGWGGTFTMKKGSIENCSSQMGGGVSVRGGAGAFIMEGGSIENCSAQNAGGGVYVGSTFTMEGGSITGCTADKGRLPNAVNVDGTFNGKNKTKIDKSLLTGINVDVKGTVEDPYRIATLDGLNDFQEKVKKQNNGLCARLMSDIVWNNGTFDEKGNYTPAEEWDPVNPWSPIESYTGTFDGGGHTIRGLYVNGKRNTAGLFENINNATIQNLSVTGYVSGETSGTDSLCVGSIVGKAGKNSKIINCTNEAIVTGNGGNGSANVGGIVGEMDDASVTDCANIGKVTEVAGDSVYVGGVVGKMNGVELSNCYSIGTLSGKGNSSYIGGIVGWAGSGGLMLTNCYWLTGTAINAVGDRQTTFDTVSEKSKCDFASNDMVRALLIAGRGENEHSWAKECGYIRTANMTLPLFKFQEADAHVHTYTGWQTDDTRHWKKCSDCEAINEKSAHQFSAEQTSPEYMKSDATCMEVAVYYKSCIDCGFSSKGMSGEATFTFGKVLAHNYDKWKSNGNDTHTHKCMAKGCTKGVETENCSGGTATCVDKAKCRVCGETYGKRNPENHTGMTKWIQTSSTHIKKWDCCDNIIVAEENHKWKNSVCTECGYSCNHQGSTQLRDAKDVTCTENGYTGDTYCKNCEAKLSSGTDILAVGHQGGTATCVDKAKCRICGEIYGNQNPENHTGTTKWIQTATTHIKKWDCCDNIIIAEESHEWKNDICMECGYGCKHQSTTSMPTCHTKAICEVCHNEYGEYDKNNHAGGTKLCHVKDATCTENGYTGDTYCMGCDTKLSSGTEIQAIGHRGGTATCTKKANCSVCGAEYGELENHSYSTDWLMNDTNHWHECVICGTKTDDTKHTDIDKDHKCDLCQKILDECIDTDKDHK